MQDVALIRNGDQKAFEQCFNQHWPSLYAFAFKTLGNSADAKDVVQQVFISIWARRDKLQINTSLEGYLHQAVKYQSLKKLQEMLGRPENLDHVQEFILPVLNDIWEKMDTADVFKEIDQQLDLLPPKTKEIFLLSRKHQLSITEISGKLNLSEKTVRNQLHIALKALRHHIAVAVVMTQLLS
ncbi:RNA polymerase sigma factor [Chitinophaga sp. Cy-1792]|uniref:RNA polymerase sigma factor n=1 Tax=Chitinophaga sp. Cy-1792 TaxID=2608339 RepID=UPI00141D8A61|nr:RNA polymerase sigma-70 factor [Chitinophaga sp. Cy-1792]NIG56733.1 RNA polymerase sigma-70 factor [Chitinophaga sp. Cy-1792]